MNIYQDLDKLYEKIEKIENENKRLHSTIKEVREYAKNDDNFFIIDAYSQPVVDRIQEELLEILDKEDKE